MMMTRGAGEEEQEGGLIAVASGWHWGPVLELGRRRHTSTFPLAGSLLSHRRGSSGEKRVVERGRRNGEWECVPGGDLRPSAGQLTEAPPTPTPTLRQTPPRRPRCDA